MQTYNRNRRRERCETAEANEMSEWPNFVANTEKLQFEDRDTFNQACDKYRNDPRLIDIGYSDMVIILDSSNSSPTQV